MAVKYKISFGHYYYYNESNYCGGLKTPPMVLKMLSQKRDSNKN
jgi:hypothetical protein